MVRSEPFLVRVLAGSYQRHLYVVEEVFEELREELGEPPHPDKVARRGVIRILPLAIVAVAELLFVVVAVQLLHVLLDLLQDLLVDAEGLVLAQLSDHELFVCPHNRRLLRNF